MALYAACLFAALPAKRLDFTPAAGDFRPFCPDFQKFGRNGQKKSSSAVQNGNLLNFLLYFGTATDNSAHAPDGFSGSATGAITEGLPPSPISWPDPYSLLPPLVGWCPLAGSFPFLRPESA
ncbi:MAG: hypothetical protein OXM02_10360, partial [Bacteroidota bacterium]|nr:hypothetical protein [Bacteroidota bacterium]